MIFVTKLSGEKYLINHNLIEKAECKPDTTLTMTSGKKIIVLESLEELFNIVLKQEQLVHSFGHIMAEKE